MSRESTEKIEEAASAWLVRRDSGDWADSDAASLQAWLAASSLHRVAFWRLEMAWEEAARLKALGAGVTSHQPPPRGDWNLTPFFDYPSVLEPPCDSPDSKGLNSSGLVHFDSPDPKPPDVEEDAPWEVCSDSGSLAERDRVATIGRDLAAMDRYPVESLPSRVSRTGRRFSIALAASVVLTVAGIAYFQLAPSADRYSTPVGGLASVPLQDGSHITLNTATEVQVALSGKERDIELTHGEAFFEVAHDKTRPFVVNVGKRRVIAVGTQFSVFRNGDDIRVVVSEGTVRLEPRVQLQEARKRTFYSSGSAPELSGSGPSTGMDASSEGSADVLLLHAGSVAHAGSSGVLVQKETESTTQEQLSWRSGTLMFRDQTLGEAAAEFNRYNERQIVIRDPAIENLKIEGSFRATNVDAFVRLLESGFPVRATEENSQILLSAN